MLIIVIVTIAAFVAFAVVVLISCFGTNIHSERADRALLPLLIIGVIGFIAVVSLGLSANRDIVEASQLYLTIKAGISTNVELDTAKLTVMVDKIQSSISNYGMLSKYWGCVIPDYLLG